MAEPVRLLATADLHSSAVVANRAMNRERQLAGINSYTRELGFNPLDRLRDQLARQGAASWLDLCCGTGRALVQAARHLQRTDPDGGVKIVGVDLVDYFDPVPQPLPGLELVTAALPGWTPGRTFDLITCVHGLHYIGDKLAVLSLVASWLAPSGMFVADLDVASIRLADGRPAGRSLSRALRAAGFSYESRTRRVTRTGPAPVSLPYRYLGADDRAGPNYTGQPAVHSHYAAGVTVEGAGRWGVRGGRPGRTAPPTRRACRCGC